MTFFAIDLKYNLPANFDAQSAEFDIFKNMAVEKCNQPEIKMLRGVRISNSSVAFNYFSVVKESCIAEENYNDYQKGYKFFLKFIFPHCNFSKKRFLLITDEWTSNYYHWHIFALEKLAVLKDAGLIEGSKMFLPKRYARYKFALSSLEKFGIKKEQIVFVRRKSNIKVAELPLVVKSHHHPEICKAVRKVLLENTTPNANLNFGDKIYISRQKQILRTIVNEAEVWAELEKRGFKKVVMEEFSYDDQINICRNAKYLIGPHGAGLTNIMFMPEGAALLELAVKPDPNKPVTDYLRLSSKLGLKYFYQECDFTGKDAHQSHLIVDLLKLKKNLDLMMS